VEVMAIFAPCRASTRAAAKPIPSGLPAPVTNATLPEKLIYFIPSSFVSFNTTDRIKH
jgi:hypothetical protein